MPVSAYRHVVALLVFAALSARQEPCRAQPTVPTRPLSDSPSRRLLEFEIGVSGQAAALSMQRWNQRLVQLKVDRVQIRQARPDDKLSISEQALGRQSIVHVLGKLDSRGQLVVPGHTFSSADVDALAQWLDELREYGPKGSPQGKPSWGLDAKQLESLRNALAKPASVDQADDSLGKVIERFRRETGLEVLAEIEENANKQEGPAHKASLPTDTSGLSWGTWTAYVLGLNGLAFEPQRTPADTVRLRIAPKAIIEHPWPVGWPPEVRNVKLVPELFKIVNVELRNVTVAELIEKLEARPELPPLLVDLGSIRNAGIDPNTALVSLPPTRGAWITNLRKMLFPAKLKSEVRIDEAGTPFLWITTLKAPDDSAMP